MGGRWGLTVFLVIVYFVPFFVAWYRNGKHGAAIFALNLLLGWTILGWIGALVWALADNEYQEPTTPR